MVAPDPAQCTVGSEPYSGWGSPISYRRYTWCVVAEPGAHRLTSPSPCVYTHRPEEAGKHTPLTGTYDYGKPRSFALGYIRSCFGDCYVVRGSRTWCPQAYLPRPLCLHTQARGGWEAYTTYRHICCVGLIFAPVSETDICGI